MPTFNIYPKKGQMFSIDCAELVSKEQGFIIRGAGKEGFLWSKGLAAITFDRTAEAKNEFDNVSFDVLLKGQTDPVKVLAFSFDPENFVFKTKRQELGSHGSVKYPEATVEVFTYIDHSRIVAILPSGFVVALKSSQP